MTKSKLLLIFGIILLIVSIVLIFWNEGRAVTTRKSLDEGQGAVIEVESNTVDENNEGELIHVSGELVTTDTLTDDAFGVSFVGVKLQRNVSMYQWVEKTESSTDKKVGRSTIFIQDISKEFKKSSTRKGYI